MDKHIENKIYDLLALKLSGDATSENLEQLQQLLVQHPSYQFLYDEMLKPHAGNEKMLEHTQQAYASHYIRHIYLQELQQKDGLQPATDRAVVSPQSRWGAYRWLTATAVAALLVAGFWGMIHFTGRQQRELIPTDNLTNVMSTAKGSKSKVKLPDGTEVVLNANSKIMYAKNFAETTREITLIGEAFFEVKHDALRPFIIHTAKADIKVLGTSFNVKNYPAEGIFETALIRGKVEVTLNDASNKKVILAPSQKFVLRKDSALKKYVPEFAHQKTIQALPDYVIEPVTIQDSMIAEISWVSNRMVYVNKPLAAIAPELERKFGVKVIFKSTKAQQKRYTGVFDDQDLEDILKILNLSNPIKYKRTKNELIIE